MLQAVVNAVREIARDEVMPRYLNVAHGRKEDGSLCTPADIAAQAALEERLAAIEDVPVVGEEMSSQEQIDGWLAGDEGVWCVDPIDGTSNFVAGIPCFAVSVAYMRRGRPILGVIYNPIADEMFWAEHGRGAFLNGARLPLKSPAEDLTRAMAGVDLKRLPRSLAAAMVSERPFYSQRNCGASTLEWCYTAAGRYDVYVHGGQRLWDYAAGALILAEAGGCIASLDHDDFWEAPLWKRSVIATATPALFDAWRNWLRAHA